MRGRNLLTGIFLGAGSAIGLVLARRRAARRLGRIDVYFADGSLVSLTGSGDAERLIGHARAALAAARG
jgi:hypothetical protein